MIHSMTGFASARGQEDGINWAIEIRGVNGKGLDLRLRVPDWIDGLEAQMRARLAGALQRGSVQLSVRLTREETAGAPRLNESQALGVLEALARIETLALERGMTLAPPTAADVLTARGVLEQAAGEDDSAALAAFLMARLDPVIAAFTEMRASEGAQLTEVLRGQLAQVEALVAQAAAEAEARAPEMAETLRRNLARVLDGAEGADAGRVAQELALIAVKADVTEEIDRLRAHVAAARDLLGQGGAAGRKLDFLMQEFNREANTICSKAQARGLTAVGLELKAVIDQMREQVQNVE